MSELTKQTLAQGSVDLWTDWLRGALLAFFSDAPDHRRVRAFAPLHIDPAATSPAGAIIDQILRLDLFSGAAPANAAVEVVRGWAPNLEPWEGGALALQLATRLGGRNLFHATHSLLAKSAGLSRSNRHELAYLSVKAAESRFRRSEVERLARLLWQMDLLELEPDLLGALALLLARDDYDGLAALPRTLLGLLPGLATPPHEGLYAEAIAKRLRVAYPEDELARTLVPSPDEEEATEAAFRRVLAENAVPWAVERRGVFSVGFASSNKISSDTIEQEREKLYAINLENNVFHMPKTAKKH